jgi:hypothetical protein
MRSSTILAAAALGGFLASRASRLLLLALLSLMPGMAATSLAQQPTIVVAPPRINPNEALDLLVTAVSGGLDLSNVTSAQISFQPGDDISEIRVLPHSNRDSISISLSVGNAQLGDRKLIILSPDLSRVIASTPVSVVAEGFECPDSQNCCRSDRKTGLCTQCQTAACPVIHVCPLGQTCCDDDGGASGHCHTCSHACP